MRRQKITTTYIASTVWHLASWVIVIALPPLLLLKKPFWLLPGDYLLQVQLVGTAYILTAAISIAVSGSQKLRIWIDLIAWAGLFGSAGLVLFLDSDSSFSRPVFGLALILAAASLIAGRVRYVGRTDALIATTPLAFIGVATIAVGVWIDLNQIQDKQTDQTIHTAYYPIEIHYHDDLVPKSQRQKGGAIARLDDKFIAVTGSGAFYNIHVSNDLSAPTSVRLPFASPTNASEFDAAVGPNVVREYFRVIDLIARPVQENWQVYVSHHFWKAVEDCVVTRVSKIDLDNALRPILSAKKTWETIFETRPCIELPEDSRGQPFAGHESGGRMAWMLPDSLLMTSGDMEYDGWNQPLAAAQEDDYLYGKTVIVNVETLQSEIYTKGHRNPQGLIIDRDGRIWSTEHGPEGGDELNLLEYGKNYGWPYQTLGTAYGRYEWPLAETYSGAGEFEEPVYSWVPSIGVSSLLRVTDSRFEKWVGNLLVASLSSKHLYRIEMRDDRVLYVEPIRIGRRIRDLIEGPHGGFWLWGDDGELISLSVARAQSRGALLFKACTGCHSTGVLSGGLGPTLWRVIGRDIAALDDYSSYSPALRKISGNWTEEKLNDFLTDPQVFAPGNSMIFPGISNANDRAAIIKYLQSSKLGQ